MTICSREKYNFEVAFEYINVTNTVQLVWETVPRSRSGRVKAMISELGSCARLHIRGFVGRSESRMIAGLQLSEHSRPGTEAPNWCARRCIMMHCIYGSWIRSATSAAAGVLALCGSSGGG